MCKCDFSGAILLMVCLRCLVVSLRCPLVCLRCLHVCLRCLLVCLRCLLVCLRCPLVCLRCLLVCLRCPLVCLRCLLVCLWEIECVSMSAQVRFCHRTSVYLPRKLNVVRNHLNQRCTNATNGKEVVMSS